MSVDPFIEVEALLQGVTSENRMTTPRRFTPTMRSGRRDRTPSPTRRRLCRQPEVGRMIEANGIERSRLMTPALHH
jgi:hypothetical protein